ncbi:hypothetical protein E2C01_028322 [Portunus trituberculatus]|uniref:Uncharacterized protein n=1 Tax=Portunus trituberculatus TaxID=210409 RepID=A0A5B7ENS1_PORTR|nr:hypothetical protein [Portunus trituberculatus]
MPLFPDITLRSASDPATRARLLQKAQNLEIKSRSGLPAASAKSRGFKQRNFYVTTTFWRRDQTARNLWLSLSVLACLPLFQFG